MVREEQGVTTNGYGIFFFFFWSNEGFLKLDVVIAAQFCEYTKTTEWCIFEGEFYSNELYLTTAAINENRPRPKKFYTQNVM